VVGKCIAKLTKNYTADLDTFLQQLRNSFFNGAKALKKKPGVSSPSHLSLAARLFKMRPKRRRRHQVLEVYQMEYREKLQEKLQISKFASLNEAAVCQNADGEWIDDADDEARMARITSARSERFSLQRSVAQKAWDEEPEEVKARIHEIARKEGGVTLSEETRDNGERTPEEYQV
jgi:uncharacterized protein YfcZ (UPF0381/DUF406 family)